MSTATQHGPTHAVRRTFGPTPTISSTGQRDTDCTWRSCPHGGLGGRASSPTAKRRPMPRGSAIDTRTERTLSGSTAATWTPPTIRGVSTWWDTPCTTRLPINCRRFIPEETGRRRSCSMARLGSTAICFRAGMASVTTDRMYKSTSTGRRSLGSRRWTANSATRSTPLAGSTRIPRSLITMCVRWPIGRCLPGRPGLPTGTSMSGSSTIRTISPRRRSMWSWITS